MATKNSKLIEELLQPKGQKQNAENTKLKMFLQAFEVNADNNMTRVYSVMQTYKTT